MEVGRVGGRGGKQQMGRWSGMRYCYFSWDSFLSIKESCVSGAVAKMVRYAFLPLASTKYPGGEENVAPLPPRVFPPSLPHLPYVASHGQGGGSWGVVCGSGGREKPIGRTP